MLRLVLLSLSVVAGSAMVCMPDTCSTVHCQAMTEENCPGGRIVKNGDFCGCCDLCVFSLEEGDNCFSSLMLGFPSTTECTEGLVCDPQNVTCKKVEEVSLGSTEVPTKAQTCAERLHEINVARDKGINPLGQYIPYCATDGSYAPVQCFGAGCYCANPMGEKLRNYQAHMGEVEGMDCYCARDQDAYRKKGLFGKIFFCTSRGNYKPYQCLGTGCFCVDKYGKKKPDSPVIYISKAWQLKC